MKKLILALFLAAAAGTSAFGQAALTFSGGNGTPLSVTLSSPVSYVLTGVAAANAGPAFVFDGLGDVFTNTGVTAGGSISYSVNGTAGSALNRLGSGTAANDVTADDAYFFPLARPGIAPNGATVTLLAGTLTTTANFAGAPPANGTYNTFIARTTTGARISTFGTNAVPEPGSVALVAAGAGLLAAGYVRRGCRRSA